MRTAASTADQSHDALYHVEAGRPVVAVCPQLGISAQTFSPWAREVTGRGLAKWHRLRQLAEEHRKLKHRGAAIAPRDRHLAHDQTALRMRLRVIIGQSAPPGL